jgi:tetratricopeptide (TPR) repeat protein
MASYGQENFTTSQILDIWNKRLSENQPNKDDGDPMNKLDLSIAMSLEGPLIKSSPEAPVLLRIVAALPGPIRHENLREIVPWIHHVDRVAAVLIRTSLMTKSPDVWEMHSTIRSYMLCHYSLDASHWENVQAFYFRLIQEAGHDPGTPDFLQRARRLSHEESNAQTLLLDALEHNFSLSLVPTSTAYSNYLFWNIPSMDIAKKTVELIRNQASPTTESLLPLSLLRLGKLYVRLDNYPKATEALEEAVHRYEQLGQMNEAAQGQVQLAKMSRLQNENTRALQLLSLAYKRFKDTADAGGMSTSLRGIGLVYFVEDRYSDALDMIMEAQKMCLPDDHICIADSQLDLGRVYRGHNPTESIRQSVKARRYYLLHGPRRDASNALYQTSIALYMRGDYDEAEVGLNEAYEELRSFRNDAQMGYSVFHLAEMNRLRGHDRDALDLYNRSANIFEHMGNTSELLQNDTRLMGNKFMVAISLNCEAEMYARLCQPDKAKQVYDRACALLGRQEKTPPDWRFNPDMPNMCKATMLHHPVFHILASLLIILVFSYPRRRAIGRFMTTSIMLPLFHAFRSVAFCCFFVFKVLQVICTTPAAHWAGQSS